MNPNEKNAEIIRKDLIADYFKDAEILAYSSQYIDNNDHIFNISLGTDAHYQNYIS